MEETIECLGTVIYGQPGERGRVRLRRTTHLDGGGMVVDERLHGVPDLVITALKEGNIAEGTQVLCKLLRDTETGAVTGELHVAK